VKRSCRICRAINHCRSPASGPMPEHLARRRMHSLLPPSSILSSILSSIQLTPQICIELTSGSGKLEQALKSQYSGCQDLDKSMYLTRSPKNASMAPDEPAFAYEIPKTP
jgi:hypothetical protein